MTDPYETIGVPKNADTETIKKTYRKRAKENHPDNGGDQQKMADLAVAYSILSDPDKRERYDKTHRKIIGGFSVIHDVKYV